VAYCIIFGLRSLFRDRIVALSHVNAFHHSETFFVLPNSKLHIGSLGVKRSIVNSTVLTIAGFDPSGHAGLLADARVFQHMDIPFQAVPTAITAQNKKQFFDWKPIDLNLFKKSLQSVEGKITGVKIGMLATLPHARVLVKWLKKTKPRWILLDPVLRSTTGTSLLRTKTFGPELRELLELTHVFTPNIPEAEWFLGRKIKTIAEMETAARELYSLGKRRERIVVLKGGHLTKMAKDQVVDLVADVKGIHYLKAKMRPGQPRGTGCTFGAALISGLYQGNDRRTAARMAKRYVLDKLF